MAENTYLCGYYARNSDQHGGWGILFAMVKDYIFIHLLDFWAAEYIEKKAKLSNALI